jgi:16S rRNA (guanine527-N7)-methyltransferase
LGYVFDVLPNVSPAQELLLSRYEELLRDRGVGMGLIAESDADRLGERHVRDSLRAAGLLTDEDRTLVDIGPGAGLPGLVLAIARPELRVILVEPKSRAVGFLELAVDRLALANVEIRGSRVEDVDLQADVATTRAFAALDRSWEAAIRVLKPGGRLIYFAGEGLEDPEAAASALTMPESPYSVLVERVVAGSSPLVMMTRQG